MQSISKILYLIGENIRDIRLGWRFPLRHALAVFRRPLRIEVPRGSRNYITLRPRTSDASTVRQVFRDREYKLAGYPQWPDIDQHYKSLLANGKIPVVIDAGANIGAASIWFSNEFPEAKVIAIEPDRENANACRKNIAGRANVSLVEAAIGAAPGFVALNNFDNEAWAVQTVRTEAESAIRVYTVPELIEKIPNAALFIVKIDIEGFEKDLFSAGTEWVEGSKVVIIEPHDWMRSTRRSSLHFQKIMGNLGFEILIAGENLVYVKT